MKEINVMSLFNDLKAAKDGDVFKLSDYEITNEHNEKEKTDDQRD